MHYIYQLKEYKNTKLQFCLVVQWTTQLVPMNATTPFWWLTVKNNKHLTTVTPPSQWCSIMAEFPAFTTRGLFQRQHVSPETLHFWITSSYNIRSLTPPLFLSLFHCLHLQNIAVCCINSTAALNNKFHWGCRGLHLLHWNVRTRSTLCKKKNIKFIIK